MTAREAVSRRMRRTFAVALIGWLSVAVGGLAGQAFPNPQVVIPFAALPGLVLFVGAVLYLHYGIACPFCGGNLGPLAVYFDGMFRPFRGFARRRAHFCPYCGTDLDAEETPGA